MSKLVFISDTHMLHEQIERIPCLAVIHTGDATTDGKLSQITKFADWLANWPANYKIFVPGNHDRSCFTKHPDDMKALFKSRGIQLLMNSGFTIPKSDLSSEISFWGMPMLVSSRTPRSYPNIPKADIILTHEPAKYRRDKVYGRALEDWEPQDGHVGHPDLVNLDCEIHACGHIHCDRGELDDTTLDGRYLLRINSAMCDDSRPLQLVHKPITVEWDHPPDISSSAWYPSKWKAII